MVHAQMHPVCLFVAAAFTMWFLLAVFLLQQLVPTTGACDPLLFVPLCACVGPCLISASVFFMCVALGGVIMPRTP